MDKKEFALAQIAPYFKDPSICGYNKANNCCLYRTADGRTCVFGKNLKEYKKEYEGESAAYLLTRYGEEILIESSRNILPAQEWEELQDIHDDIARGNPLTGTSLFTHDELVQYCNPH